VLPTKSPKGRFAASRRAVINRRTQVAGVGARLARVPVATCPEQTTWEAKAGGDGVGPASNEVSRPAGDKQGTRTKEGLGLQSKTSAVDTLDTLKVCASTCRLREGRGGAGCGLVGNRRQGHKYPVPHSELPRPLTAGSGYLVPTRESC
jgi:hypothetical protein